MKKNSNIFFNILALLLLIAYITAGSMLYNQKSEQNRCEKLNISVLDSAQAKFLTPQIITQLLDTVNLNPLKIPIHRVPIQNIEKILAQNPYVKAVEVHTNINGECNIEILQKIPKLRITTQTGYDFYLDSALNIIKPTKYYNHNVRIITGNITFAFPKTFQGQLIEKNTLKDRDFFKKLINFANGISEDDFISSLVTQIYVDANGDIYLVPRVGQHKIIFGTLDAYNSKLAKLKNFYTQNFRTIPQSTQTINVKYKNQIILK